MDNETLASLLRGRNRAGQPVDATANIIGPAMSALGNTIYGAGRGALTAMAGLPGDINQLITDNIGTLVNAQGLPTTKEIQDFLPAKPTSYEGKLAQKLGEFVPVNPTPIAKGAVAIAKPVGKAMGEQAYRMTEDMLAKQGMMPSVVPRKEMLEQEIAKVEDYRGSHTAPNAKVYGGTIDKLEQIMPKDVYSQQGRRLYGINDSTIDHEWYMAALRAKGKPDAMIEVYRAVPKGVKNINNGDWVTTSKKYATDHGENTLNGEYEIVSKKVKANTLSSEGYPYEFGYNE
jgi:hypothetical protein